MILTISWKFIGRNRMKQHIETVFPLAKNCFETTESQICGIAEEVNKETNQKGKCYLIENSEEGILKISNLSRKVIFLLAIDGCIFSSIDEKRCDCALFNDEVFYFIEIKDSTKASQRSNSRKEAVLQLKATLREFLNRLDFKHYQQNQLLNALICFRFQKRYPAQVTTSKQNEVDFWDNFYAKLYEGNEVEF